MPLPVTEILPPRSSSYSQNMNTKLRLTTTLLLALLGANGAFAAGDHGHDHAPEAAHAGHADDDHDHALIVRSQAGFTLSVTVDEARKARVCFLDAAGKPSALTTQSISGIAGERSSPTKLTFSRGTGTDANVLIADQALPATAHVSVILSIRTTPEAKAVTERFMLHLH